MEKQFCNRGMLICGIFQRNSSIYQLFENTFSGLVTSGIFLLFMIESHVFNPVEQQEIHESTKYCFLFEQRQTCSRYFLVHKIIDERMSVVKGN